MKCVDSPEVMRLCAGQLSVERAELLNVHFNHCPKCAALRDEIGAITSRLGHASDEYRDETAVDEVMALIRMGKADREEAVPSRKPFWRLWQTQLLIPATALVTAVLMLTFWPREDRNRDYGFQARSDEKVNLDRWVSLKVFRTIANGHELVRDVIAADDALAFTYLNRPGNQLRYLAVVGVDERGACFWYYPAHPDATKNPSSISIKNTLQPIELPEQVAHDLSSGPLRIFGIFSSEPLTVRTIEQQLKRDLRVAHHVERLSRLGLRDVGQHSVLLQVREPRQKDDHR